MMQVKISYTSWLLEQWVKWSRENPISEVDYKPVSLFETLVRDSRAGYLISDETGCLVDRAVSRLLKRDRELGKALVIYFSSGKNLSFVIRTLKIDRLKANVLVKSAIAWIDAVLDVAKAA